MGDPPLSTEDIDARLHLARDERADDLGAHRCRHNRERLPPRDDEASVALRAERPVVQVERVALVVQLLPLDRVEVGELDLVVARRRRELLETLDRRVQHLLALLGAARRVGAALLLLFALLLVVAIAVASTVDGVVDHLVLRRVGDDRRRSAVRVAEEAPRVLARVLVAVARRAPRDELRVLISRLELPQHFTRVF